MSRPTRDTAAGRAYLDLQNRARREGRATQELLTMYVVERWLARLSSSPYRDDFVLKGGMLLASMGSRRPTVDADALARNMPSDPQTVARRIAEIAATPDPDDGVHYLIDTLTTRPIRDDALYAGVRAVMEARVATAQVKLRLDINFGDPVTPAPQLVDLPALRPSVGPIRVLGYPIETVLAEKLATAIELGPANTRVRDFADIYTLIGTHRLGRGEVRDALFATAAHRRTTVLPLSAVTGRLAVLRAGAYAAYRHGLGRDGHALPTRFDEILQAVSAFADPLVGDQTPGQQWDPGRWRWTVPE